MDEVANLLTTIPSRMVILLLLGALLLVAEVLVLLFALLRPLSEQLRTATRITFGITGAKIEIIDEGKPAPAHSERSDSTRQTEDCS